MSRKSLQIYFNKNTNTVLCNKHDKVRPQSMPGFSLLKTNEIVRELTNPYEVGTIHSKFLKNVDDVAMIVMSCERCNYNIKELYNDEVFKHTQLVEKALHTDTINASVEALLQKFKFSKAATKLIHFNRNQAEIRKDNRKRKHEEAKEAKETKDHRNIIGLKIKHMRLATTHEQNYWKLSPYATVFEFADGTIMYHGSNDPDASTFLVSSTLQESKSI
jgi:predicted nucleic-acid-binding Zn-ribbon protein